MSTKFELPNYDREAGIFYGVISQNSISPESNGEMEPYYGDPSCPECGNPVLPVRQDFDYYAECGVFVCEECNSVHYPMELCDGATCPDCLNTPATKVEFKPFRERACCEDYACLRCGLVLSSEDAYPEEPIGWWYDKDGYILTDCLDSDIMVIKSPYYTYAPECSPCVPEAGNLDQAGRETCRNSRRAYCLGHDWFDGDIAPYPVFRVSDGVKIIAQKVEIDCPYCNGTGARTIASIAKARGITEEQVYQRLQNDENTEWFSPSSGPVKCWACNGTGKRNEFEEREEE